MVSANEVPKVTNILSAEKPKDQPTLAESERQNLLLEKLDLTGLEAWPADQAERARSLLKEYHDIFSLEKHDMGHTKATKIQILPHLKRDSVGIHLHNLMRCMLI